MYLTKAIPIALLTTLATASLSPHLEARGYTACQDAEMGLDRAIAVFTSRSNGLGAQRPKALPPLIQQLNAESQTIKKLCAQITGLLDQQHQDQVNGENKADKEAWLRKSGGQHNA
ncbi:hypothetical protein BDV38DRAFT_281518 [Aspergillus pseudotamarii]|uniref:Secreted protein n=1 Tax=Aspergillus pseudotamarii TaxID=132259 RepID=A0A5N6SW90_ASPPS|nr:uncharacterized protein BDV38DRAFT_281518 [Aspergillus pseudotamarii]KAE8138958.1 hypothetical protein BDV38DRAFT_281518 [Aspergillus pseudotamarii]